MKRSDFYIKVITGVLFAAIAAYIGVYIYNSMINVFVTMPSVRYTVVEAAAAHGFAVRTETVLADSRGMTLPVVDDGVRVASGQAVAVEYLSRDALEIASELHATRLRIAQLESAFGGGVTVTGSRSVVNLSRAIHTDRLHTLPELSLQIETYVFNTASPEDELPRLRAQLAHLENALSGARTIYAPASGLFSQVIDGFEHIGPQDVRNLTPSRLSALFSSASGETGVGKLVTGNRWYFAAVMDTADAAALPLRRDTAVQFSGAYHASVNMRVESVGQSEDGKSVVIFSSNRNLHDIVPLRSLRAEIIFNEISGIRVPKEAMHLDENGTTFVFIQAGRRAERVNVNILMTAYDSYLVESIVGLNRPDPLRPGATIIVRANNLVHGTIVG